MARRCRIRGGPSSLLGPARSGRVDTATPDGSPCLGRTKRSRGRRPAPTSVNLYDQTSALRGTRVTRPICDCISGADHCYSLSGRWTFIRSSTSVASQTRPLGEIGHGSRESGAPDDLVGARWRLTPPSRMRISSVPTTRIVEPMPLVLRQLASRLSAASPPVDDARSGPPSGRLVMAGAGPGGVSDVWCAGSGAIAVLPQRPER